MNSASADTSSKLVSFHPNCSDNAPSRIPGPGPAVEPVTSVPDDFLTRTTTSFKNSGITSIISNLFSSTPREYRQYNMSKKFSSRITREQNQSNAQNMYLSSDNQPSLFHNINTNPCRNFIDTLTPLDPAEQPMTTMTYSQNYNTFEQDSMVHNRPLPPLPPQSDTPHSRSLPSRQERTVPTRETPPHLTFPNVTEHPSSRLPQRPRPSLPTHVPSTMETPLGRGRYYLPEHNFTAPPVLMPALTTPHRFHDPSITVPYHPNNTLVQVPVVAPQPMHPTIDPNTLGGNGVNPTTAFGLQTQPQGRLMPGTLHVQNPVPHFGQVRILPPPVQMPLPMNIQGGVHP